MQLIFTRCTICNAQVLTPNRSRVWDWSSGKHTICLYVSCCLAELLLFGSEAQAVLQVLLEDLPEFGGRFRAEVGTGPVLLRPSFWVAG